jgi:hypothetical protein
VCQCIQWRAEYPECIRRASYLFARAAMIGHASGEDVGGSAMGGSAIAVSGGGPGGGRSGGGSKGDSAARGDDAGGADGPGVSMWPYLRLAWVLALGVADSALVLLFLLWSETDFVCRAVPEGPDGGPGVRELGVLEAIYAVLGLRVADMVGCFSLSLPPSLPPSLSLCFSLSFFLSVSLSLSLCFSLCLRLSVSFSLSHFRARALSYLSVPHAPPSPFGYRRFLLLCFLSHHFPSPASFSSALDPSFRLLSLCHCYIVFPCMRLCLPLYRFLFREREREREREGEREEERSFLLLSFT